MNAGNDNITASTAAGEGPSSRRPWLRHSSAAVVALALNVGLVGLLATWRADNGGEVIVPVRTVPLRVVEPEPVEARVEPAERTVPPAAPPVSAAPLQVPADPQIPVVRADIEPPAPGRLPVGEFDITAVPAFAALVPASPAATTGPVGPSPAPGSGTKPAPAGPARGATMIKPPNLSDYYPRRALRRGTTGRTTVRLTIDSRGRVEAVRVIASTPAGVFETAAGRAARSLTFLPARRAGRPVRASVTLNLVWKLD